MWSYDDGVHLALQPEGGQSGVESPWVGQIADSPVHEHPTALEQVGGAIRRPGAVVVDGREEVPGDPARHLDALGGR